MMERLRERLTERWGRIVSGSETYSKRTILTEKIWAMTPKQISNLLDSIDMEEATQGDTRSGF